MSTLFRVVLLFAAAAAIGCDQPSSASPGADSRDVSSYRLGTRARDALAGTVAPAQAGSGDDVCSPAKGHAPCSCGDNRASPDKLAWNAQAPAVRAADPGCIDESGVVTSMCDARAKLAEQLICSLDVHLVQY